MSEEKPHSRIDINQATAIFEDSQGWFKSAWVAALNALIPFLGPVVVIGWGRALYEHGLTEPNQLTEVAFERDLNIGKDTAPGILGWPAALLAIDGLRRILVWGTGLLLRQLTEHLGPDLLVQLEVLLYGGSRLASWAVTLLWIPWVLLLPELVRRVYQGDAFPWQNPGPSMLAIKMNLDGYQKVVVMSGIVLGVSWIVSGVFGWLALFVAPLAWAVLVHLAAQWHRVVADHGVPGTV